MYDPLFNAVFKISDPNAPRDGRWWSGEPIWVTARKQVRIFRMAELIFVHLESNIGQYVLAWF
jgi:hypothetical protein